MTFDRQHLPDRGMIDEKTMPLRDAILPACLLLAAACGDEPVRVPPPPAPAGSLEVTWALLDPGGVEVTCDDVGFVAFQVRIGAEPIVVPCGEPQLISVERMTPGRYPLVIQPEVFAGQTVEQYSYRTNLDVRDMERTTHHAPITIDPAGLDSGNIDLRWRIEGMPAATQCAAIGATTLRVVSDEGSIDPFEIEVPCATGSHRLEQRRRGDYNLFLSLRNASGATVMNLLRTLNVTVVAGETHTADINFSVGTTTLGALETRWTITSSGAAVDCPAVSGEMVEVTVLTRDPQMQFIPVATATAACTAGVLGIDRLPAANFYRVRYALFDVFGTLISQLLEEPVAFTNTRTTTTAVVFTVD